MKTTITVLLFAAILIGCKDVGDIKHKVKYTTSDVQLRAGSVVPDSLYTAYGDYITSVTPYHLSSKMSMLNFLDVWEQSPTSNFHMISYVDGHDNEPGYEIATYADFSGNKEVTIDPILYGETWKGIYVQKSVFFKFIIFSPQFIYQEFEAPIEYKDLALSNNNQLPGNAASVTYDAINNKLIAKAYEQNLISRIYQNSYSTSKPFAYVFGNTDSTYIYKANGQNLEEAQRFPFWNETGKVIVRCSKYSPITVNMPEDGETITMYSTISFDCTDLIQIYAGQDNIPYTYDDVFIYAPKYWERLKVRLDVF